MGRHDEASEIEAAERIALRAVQDALSGRIRLGERIGRGQSGTVRHGVSEQALYGRPKGSDFAVKIVRVDARDDGTSLERARREGLLGAQVDDPHLVRIHETGSVTEDGHSAVYLLQDFVHGRTLRGFLQDHGAASDALVRHVGAQAARGLAALHRLGICHRDVKPENLLITPDSELRLVDLGLAAGSQAGPELLGPEPPRASSGIRGAFGYTAPEVLRGQAHEPAADLYALGTVLFELATGRHPFAYPGQHPDELLRTVLRTEAPRATDVDASLSSLLDEVLARLLSKEPNERPAGAVEIAEVLELGERSDFWQRLSERAPRLAARARLEALRRPTPTPFVGRDRERAVLDRALESADRAGPHAVEIIGPPGTGRRRLCDDRIAHWLSENDQLEFLGAAADAALSASTDAPLPALIVDWLCPGERRDGSLPRARLAVRCEEELATVFDEPERRRLVAALAGDPDPRAEDLIDLYSRALLAIATARGRTVVRIDRAEQLGQIAREVVRRTLAANGVAPLLWLLVADRPFAEQPFAGETLRVEGLDHDDFITFGSMLFDLDLVEAKSLEPLLTDAWRSFSGQPRALTESLEDLVTSGSLQGRPGSFHSLDVEIEHLDPAGSAIQRLIDRLQSLDETTRHALRVAAVLGDQFLVDDVAAATGRPRLEVLEHLGAFDERVVAVQGESGRFRHREFRRAALADSPSEVLRRLHRNAAWTLEDRGAPTLEVALHLSRAGEHDACVDPLLEATEQRIEGGALRGAARLLQRTRLHLAELTATPTNRARRRRFARASSRLHVARGDPERADRLWREVARSAQADDDSADRARAALGLAELAQAGGRYFAALQHLGDAEAHLENATGGDDELRAHVARIHGRVLAYLGQCQEAAAVTSAGIRTTQDITPALRSDLEIDLGRWNALRLHFDHALDSIRRGRSRAERHGARYSTLRAQMHEARVLGQRGALDRADSALIEIGEHCRRTGNAGLEARCGLSRIEIAIYHPDRPIERSLLFRTRHLAERTGDHYLDTLLSAYEALLFDELPEEIPELNVPTVDLTWKLVHSMLLQNTDPDLAVGILDEALLIERAVDTPFTLRIALARAAGLDDKVQRLIRRLAHRIRDPLKARRFSQNAERIRLAHADVIDSQA